MNHKVNQTRNTKLRSLSCCYLLFNICYLLFVICYLLFVMIVYSCCYLPFAVIIVSRIATSFLAPTAEAVAQTCPLVTTVWIPRSSVAVAVPRARARCRANIMCGASPYSQENAADASQSPSNVPLPATLDRAASSPRGGVAEILRTRRRGHPARPGP